MIVVDRQGRSIFFLSFNTSCYISGDISIACGERRRKEAEAAMLRFKYG